MVAGVIGFVLGLAGMLLAIAALIACAVLWSVLIFGGYRALFALFTRRRGGAFDTVVNTAAHYITPRRKPRHDASDDLVHGDCPLISDDLKRNHARFTSTEGQRHAAHR